MGDFNTLLLIVYRGKKVHSTEDPVYMMWITQSMCPNWHIQNITVYADGVGVWGRVKQGNDTMNLCALKNGFGCCAMNGWEHKKWEETGKKKSS